MKFTPKLGAALAAAVLVAAGCSHSNAAKPADAKVGAPAPEFTLTDWDGKDRSLGEFEGKHVVLEWWNHGCPFVEKHYDGKNMQALQKEMTGKDVAWLSIVSSAPGKQGHVDGAKAKEIMGEYGAAPTAVLHDPDGKVGRMYGAQTTPHMFVIDPDGTLIYAGAIDDQPSVFKRDFASAKNYVVAAVEASMSGGTVTDAVTEPYGCGVKYD